MLVICPSCATSYDLEPAILLPEGRYVRCLRCRMVWHVAPTRADKLLAAAVALGPEPTLAEGFLAAEGPVGRPEPPISIAWSNESADGTLGGEPAMVGGSLTVTCGDLIALERWVAAAADDEESGEDRSLFARGDDAQPAEDEAVLVVADDDQAVDDGSALAAGDDAEVVDDGSFSLSADDLESAATDETAADEVDETIAAEVPIAPVDLDEGRLPIEIDENPPAPAAAPLGAMRRSAGWPHLSRARYWSPPRWPLSRLHTGILALFIVDCLIVGWRGHFVRAFPQTDSFYKLVGLPVNLRGLVFDGITTTTEQHEGVPVLVVEGSIVNNASKSVAVPRLKFVVRNAGQQEISSWTAVASHRMLPPGEAVSFRTRLASPPANGRDVLLRFVDRRDIVAAVR